MSLGLALVLLACAADPQSFADCDRLGDATAREDCRLAMALDLLDQPAALDAAVSSVEDVESRDLLLLRLATAQPTRASGLCTRVTTPGAAEKCRQVLGRPHLSTTPQPPR